MRVNSQGKRYSDEGILGVYGLLHRSHRTGPGAYYSIFDSRWPEYIQSQCQEHFMSVQKCREGRNEKARNERSCRTRSTGRSYGTRQAHETDGESCIWGANTLDELAGFIGFSGETKKTFLVEIERYNKMCRTRDVTMISPRTHGFSCLSTSRPTMPLKASSVIPMPAWCVSTASSPMKIRRYSTKPLSPSPDFMPPVVPAAVNSLCSTLP